MFSSQATGRVSAGRRRFSAWLVLPFLLSALVMFAAPQPSQAASGGRIGGGSFRSAPSMPRNFSGGAVVVSVVAATGAAVAASVAASAFPS